MVPHQQAMNKAKIALMARPDSAFFTTVCFSLKHVWDETCPTAYTDGAKIGFNPEFFMSLTAEERVFVLIHESMHVAYLHMDRLQGRDRRKWNIAADHVINLQLLERGFQMPKIGLADPQYKDLSTEEVYKLLPDSKQQPMMADLADPAQSSEQLSQDVQDILVRAAIQSKMAGDKPGTIPGEIQIFLDNLLNPKLPWNRILQRHMQALAKNDYSFRRPNRRFFPKHHLPSLHSEKLLNVAIAVDTSGSVSDEEFKQFVSEVSLILRTQRPDKITLVQFDTALKSVDEIRNVQELMQLKFTGRGGTRIGPVIEWANATKPHLLLIFSDGHFRFFGNEDTKTKIVWLIHDNPAFTAPMGKVIHYEM